MFPANSKSGTPQAVRGQGGNLGVLVEEVEEDAGEVVGVVVGEAQLVGQGIQEQVAPLRVQVGGQLLEDVCCLLVHHRLLPVLGRQLVQRLHSPRFCGPKDFRLSWATIVLTGTCGSESPWANKL